MPSSRRFPPPWTIEELNDACFVVSVANGQKLGYFYFEEGAGRRSAAKLVVVNLGEQTVSQRTFMFPIGDKVRLHRVMQIGLALASWFAHKLGDPCL
jgi:hypothetical protein